MSNIQVWDAIMGSGKTSGAVDWMIANPQNRYIYLTPFVTEAENRIKIAGGETLNFACPDDKVAETKSENLLYLLQSGRNIATTHALYQLMTEHHYDLLKDYVVIMDEVVDFMDVYKCDEGDFKNICGDFVDIDYTKFGQIIPLRQPANKRSGNIAGIFNDAEKGIIYASNNSTKVFVTQLPLRLLTSAKRTIILTYRFSGSTLAAFLALHGIFPEPFLEGELLNSEDEIREHIKTNLILPSLQSVDSLPDHRGFLNATWCKEVRPKEVEPVRNALRGIFRKHKPADILMTCRKENIFRTIKGVDNPRWFGDGQYVIPKYDKPEPLKNTFLSCNARAMNDYKAKSVMVHAFNREPHGSVKTYLGSYGTTLNSDEYALSEMLQWLWRGCIRDLKNPKPMSVYILSARMKNLLTDWLDSVEIEELIEE